MEERRREEWKREERRRGRFSVFRKLVFLFS
jgi:hypothetical protein